MGTEAGVQLLGLLKLLPAAGLVDHMAFWAWAGIVTSAAMTIADVSSDAAMSA
jgi:hypothetical protein